MVRKKVKQGKRKEGAWFYPLRRSFLPCSSEGWMVEAVVAVLFFAGLIQTVPFLEEVLTSGQETAGKMLDAFIVVLSFALYTTILGVAATWIAIRKS